VAISCNPSRRRRRTGSWRSCSAPSPPCRS
jgi:hypothetical protein